MSTSYPYDFDCTGCVYRDSAKTLEEADELCVTHLRRCPAAVAEITIFCGLDSIKVHTMQSSNRSHVENYYREQWLLENAK